jgi:hypothetical protein
MGSNDQFPISVVLYPHEGFWIAQGLEHDIVARGNTAEEASKNFNQKFGAELVMSMEIGDQSPLAGVPRAPKEFWDKYKAIKHGATLDESDIEVGNGHISHVRKRIKIAA